MKRFAHATLAALALVLALATTPAGTNQCLADDNAELNIASHLQDISVTIVSLGQLGGGGEGSGVIKTRTLPSGESVNFVWTAAHVVDNLRHTKTVVDAASGSQKTVVEFDDALVVKALVEDGRTVGKTELYAEVVRFNKEEDFALLRLRKKDFVDSSVDFYLEDDIPAIGTKLLHVGSLLGQLGSNSMTDGIMSQHGRIVDKKIFDQTTVVAFPGCLTADTMIAMMDGSSVSISDLMDRGGADVIAYDSRISMANGTWSNSIKPGDQLLSFQTINGEIAKKTGTHNLRPVTRGKAVRVWETGVKPVLKISTRNRSVRASDNHPFVRAVPVDSLDGRVYWVAQWCPAGKLKAGDVVGVMKEHVEYRKSEGINFTLEFGPKENHKPMMRLLGFYIGDGYSRIRQSEGGEVDLYTFEDDDSNLYSSIIKQCFGREPSRIATESGEYLQLCDVKVAAKFKKWGVTGYAETKRIPSWVFQAPREFQREFLEGIVDADGHRRRDCWQVELANKALVEDIHTLAMNLGMGTSNISNRCRVAVLDGREIASEFWSVEVYPDPVKTGAEMIGTLDLLPSGLKFERISSVQPDGEEMTYDMEVASYHNFFANGFLVHNSSGGGVYTTDGRLVGLVLRGAGETFNLIAPVRRIVTWAKHAGVEWAVNDDVDMPSEEDLAKLPVDDNGVTFNYSSNSPGDSGDSHEHGSRGRQPDPTKFLLRTTTCPCGDNCACDTCECSQPSLIGDAMKWIRIHLPAAN